MCCVQAAVIKAKPAAAAVSPETRRGRLLVHINDLTDAERFEKDVRLLHIEVWIAGLDRQEETVAAGARERADVEQRMVGLRMSIQDEQSSQHGQRGEQDGQFEDDWDEHLPAIERPAADVDRQG